MNKLKIDFGMNIARFDYFQRYLIALLGMLVSGGVVIASENIVNEVILAIIISFAVVGILYFYVYALAALVGRFRSMGIEKNVTMVFSVIGFAIAQAVFAPFALIPFLWSPKSA